MLVVLLLLLSTHCYAGDWNKFVSMIVPDGERDFSRCAHGTSFTVLAPSGNAYTMTNAHVCLLAKKNKMINVHPNGEVHTVSVLAMDFMSDLCILESDQQVAILVGDEVAMGEDVAHAGYAGRVGMTEHSGVVLSKTTMSAHVGKITLYEYLISAKVYPGASGSPLVNRRGYLVGVVVACDVATHNGYVVPLEDVKRFLRSY